MSPYPYPHFQFTNSSAFGRTLSDSSVGSLASTVNASFHEMNRQQEMAWLQHVASAAPSPVFGSLSKKSDLIDDDDGDAAVFEEQERHMIMSRYMTYVETTRAFMHWKTCYSKRLICHVGVRYSILEHRETVGGRGWFQFVQSKIKLLGVTFTNPVPLKTAWFIHHFWQSRIWCTSWHRRLESVDFQEKDICRAVYARHKLAS